MTTDDIIHITIMLAMIAAYVDSLRSIARLKRRQEHLKDELSRHWREHKDDHHEVERNHRKLVDALGMKEVRATPSQLRRTT